MATVPQLLKYMIGKGKIQQKHIFLFLFSMLCYKNITQHTSFTSLFGCVCTGTFTHTCVSGLCKQSDPLPSLYGIERDTKRDFARYRRLARN
jgi:hypothetical protein